MPIIGSQYDKGQFSQAHEDSPYEYYTCKITYYWNSGKKQLPIAKDDMATDPPVAGQMAQRQKAAIVQVCAPYGWKLVQWASQRDGDHPHVPPPDPSDDNFVLMDGGCTVDPPMLTTDANTHLYRAQGYYLFAMIQPVWFKDGLDMGATPYDNSP
jgi:hypothetical protein